MKNQFLRCFGLLLAAPSLVVGSNDNCTCDRNYTSADNTSFTVHVGVKDTGVTPAPEDFTAQLSIAEGGHGGVCYSPSACNEEEESCDWTYTITVNVVDSPGATQIVKVRHRGTDIAPNASGVATFNKTLTRSCGDSKVLQVRALDSLNNVISTATLETLTCEQCDAIG